MIDLMENPLEIYCFLCDGVVPSEEIGDNLHCPYCDKILLSM